MFDPKEIANGVSRDFDKEIDPYLSKWQAYKHSGWVAVVFGVALMAIGGVLALILVC